MKNKNETKNKITIWFDMDGVTTTYTDADFHGGKSATWLKPGYFKKLTPCNEMCKLFRATIDIQKRNNSFINSTNILTTIQPEPEYYKDQYNSKLYWVTKYLIPRIKNAEQYFHITTAGTPKPEIAEKILGRKLTKKDILIDDYNKNIKIWEEAGGTGIKYLNTLNTPATWKGKKIWHDTHVHDKIKQLYTVAVT